MSSSSTKKRKPKRKVVIESSVTPEQEEDAAAQMNDDRSIYSGFKIWTNQKKTPSWHPVKRVHYVFFRMMNGCTISDALIEIGWNASEFWHLIDLKRNDAFRVEYSRAKLLQGRAIGDSVMAIAEGRDRVTKKSRKRIRLLVKKELRRAGKQKSPIRMKMIMESLLGKIADDDRNVLSRNKLQIDSAKWLAKATNPSEFGDKTNMTLGAPAEGDGKPLVVQFVGPDGMVVVPT